ncbi:hypothetical protein GCM10010307_26460 [Streptomyces vastus]|uniref:Uncharacterized protein n=1 Tax=Streptomyces vastus TaxID=285451 RepID=A0ABP6D4S6_9ACTN
MAATRSGRRAGAVRGLPSQWQPGVELGRMARTVPGDTPRGWGWRAGSPRAAQRDRTAMRVGEYVFYACSPVRVIYAARQA